MWRYAAARATGRSHLKSALPCQDRLGCRVLADGSFIATVSDGAGSAPQSGLGAEIAVATVLSEIERCAETGFSDLVGVMQDAAGQARVAIIREADKLALEPRQFACTLLVLFVGERGGAAMQLGDGVMVVNSGQEDWSWIFWPQRGEYANTTRFLTDDDALSRLQAEPLSGGIQDVALMSDGLESLALHYATQAVHDPFFNGIFRPLLESDGVGDVSLLSESLERFLTSDRVGSRTDDDLSLILATRRPPGGFP